MLFGNMALHLNRDLTINPQTRVFLDDEEAVQLMSHPAPRKEWSI